MTTTSRAPGSVLSSALWGLQLIVAIVATVQVYFRRIEIPHCDLQCDFAALDLTGNLFVVLAFGLFILVGILQMMLPGQPRWWLPVLGVAITVVAALVADYISDIALLLR